MNRHVGPLTQVTQLSGRQAGERVAKALDGVHGIHITDIGKSCQPHSVSALRYVRSMNPMSRPDLRAVVRQNCERLYLFKKRAEEMVWSAFASDVGIGNGTAQRINEQTNDPSLATIDSIARYFGLAAWQMLVPHLDPADPPAILLNTSQLKMLDALEESALALAETRAEYNKDAA